MIPVAWLGVFTADTLLFRIGAKLGPKVIEHHKLKRLFTPERVARREEPLRTASACGPSSSPAFIPRRAHADVFCSPAAMGVTQRDFWVADGARGQHLRLGSRLRRLSVRGLPRCRTWRAFGGLRLARAGGCGRHRRC